jgi:pimeloyl-ACP methyl ester carboxylesterase
MLHAIERAGHKPATVFIHGFGQSSVYWREWVELLAERGRQAVAVDLPGFGASASEPGPYTLESLADAVATHMMRRRLGPANVVGNSMGSTVAQFLTLRHPQAVRRLVLTATSAYVEPRIANSAPRTPEEELAYWSHRDIVEMVDGFFESRKPPTGHADAFYAAGRKMSVAAAVEANRSNLRWRTLERLPEITVPTLIVQGRHDTAKTPQQGALMVEAMHDARLVVLEESAHTPPWDEPDAFRAAVLPFLLEERTRLGHRRKS